MPQKRGARPTTIAEAWAAFEKTCIPDDAPEALKLAFRFTWRAAFADVTRLVQGMHKRHPDLELADVEAAMTILFERHEQEREAQLVALFRRKPK